MAGDKFLSKIIARYETEILQDWIGLLVGAGAVHGGRIKEAELRAQCRSFLQALRAALNGGGEADSGPAAFAPVHDLLGEISRSRAVQGFSPSETATFVFSLKQPVFALLGREYGTDATALSAQIWAATRLLDGFGLHCFEVFQQSREEVILRQQEEIAELSTPVVKLWQGILALPLIGTLDSGRTQVLMETLLQAIVDESAETAIIDITGVPTVDTLVAQHLLKTIAAARLMGADCIISGVRPQIAQTMVHLGVELNVTSKATMADAFALALRQSGKTVTTIAAR